MQTEILNDERSASKDPLVGSLIDGKYRVDALIGEGGMGKVYRGTNVRTESPVAIKTLIPDLVRDETLVRRFEVEAKSASNLRHPNTIRIYDFGREGDLLFMVMELLDGSPLEKFAGDGNPMDPLRVIHIFRQTCRSLHEAHDAGMVHRDLKPDNIFLNRVGGETEFVKVLDFGVAKLQDNRFTDSTLTQAGMIFGTPRYMSPEQARAENIDRRSDIYALGVILYECLSGHVPFDGRDPISILIQHVNEIPRSFADINPSLPAMPDLEAITFRCLEKNPNDRYEDVLRLLEDLERVERRLLGHAALPGDGATRSLDGRDVAPVTRRHGAAPGRNTPDSPLERLGVGNAGDPTFVLGDGTLHIDAGGAAAKSRAPLVGVIGGVVVILAVAAYALSSIVASDTPDDAAVSDTTTAASRAASADEGAAPVGEPEPTAPMVEPPSTPRVDASVQSALAHDRLGAALRSASTEALRAVVVVRIAEPEGVEQAVWRREGTDAEPLPLPAELLLVRTQNTPDELSFVVSAQGYRDEVLRIPFASVDEPIVPQLRRASTGGSRTDRTSGGRTGTGTGAGSGGGGLENPYR